MYSHLKLHLFRPLPLRNLFQGLVGRDDRTVGRHAIGRLKANRDGEIAAGDPPAAPGFRVDAPEREKSAASSTLLLDPYFDGLTGPRWW